MKVFYKSLLIAVSILCFAKSHGQEIVRDNIESRKKFFGLNSSVEAAQFFTPWEQYSNSSVTLKMRSSYQIDRFALDSTLALRATDNQTLFSGNIHQLEYRWGVFSIGRVAPIEHKVHPLASSASYFNQALCLDPLNCFEGGSIGLHAKTKKISLSLSLLQLPDLMPGPTINSDGQLESQNRWTLAPIRAVNTAQGEFPLVNSTEIPSLNELLLRPGLRAGFYLLNKVDQRLDLHLAIEPTQNARIKDRQGLALATINSENQLAVRNNMEVSFPYQVIAATFAEISSGISGLNIVVDASAFAQENFSGAQVFVGPKLFHDRVFYVTALLGWLNNSDEQYVQAAQLSAKILVQKWTISQSALWAQSRNSDLGRSFLFQPKIEWGFLKNQSIWLKADLLIATSGGAPILGQIRGNDQILIGWAYAL